MALCYSCPRTVAQGRYLRTTTTAPCPDYTLRIPRAAPDMASFPDFQMQSTPSVDIPVEVSPFSNTASHTETTTPFDGASTVDNGYYPLGPKVLLA